MTDYRLLFDRLIFTAARAAEWRRGVMARHPGDPRNGRAIQSLSGLAKAKYADVSPTAWDALAPYIDRDCLNEAINQANRAVGFSSHPHGFDEYVKSIATLAQTYALPASIGGAQ